MKELRPNSKRAKVTIFLLLLMSVLSILYLVSELLSGALFYFVSEDAAINWEYIEKLETVSFVLAILRFVGFISLLIAFGRWFWRAYYNLHQKINYLRYASGWAAAAWLVPVIALYRPYKITRELFQETKELLGKNGISFGKTPSKGYLIIWWIIWLLAGINENRSFRYLMICERQDYMIAHNVEMYIIYSILSGVFFLTTILLTIRIVKDYFRLESRLPEIAGKSEAEEADLFSQARRRREMKNDFL